ncbi:MAG: MTAP family purine nucleoside phosphorylase [Candidatus Altiarchaeota archaeon]
MIGVIGGTGLKHNMLVGDADPVEVETPYGTVSLRMADDFCFLPRHGLGHETPPHRIEHRANLKALESVGVADVIGVSSVGGLREEFRPGSIVVPSDYIDFSSHVTFFDGEVRHVTPGFDGELRGRIISASARAGVKVTDGGVYVQTRGPRLETKAEVAFLGGFADVVGMTVGSEATLAGELGLKYACVCSVDNYANGVGGGRLDFADIVLKAGANADRIVSLIRGLLE